MFTMFHFVQYFIFSLFEHSIYCLVDLEIGPKLFVIKILHSFAPPTLAVFRTTSSVAVVTGAPSVASTSMPITPRDVSLASALESPITVRVTPGTGDR